jgi:hypothetical protein
MALTRLKNIITSRTGRIIYVNPDDFDASDSFDNRGNSALRPFKTLQRALLEVARFSYRVGLSNDEFDAFTIYLYPSEYIIDNRPGVTDYTTISPFDANTNFDITSSSNVLWKFNSLDGGVIVPRGCSIVGSDLRRTKIIPKYVPYPATSNALNITSANEPGTASIFKVTGGCYFWQFTFLDGDNNGVYYTGNNVTTIAPNYSHHKLTCFEFADLENLDLYYQKISKAYTAIPDTSGITAQDQLQTRVEENRIVGPISDEFKVLQIIKNGQTATAFTVDSQGNPVNHGFSVGVSVNVSGVTGPTTTDASLYNGSFLVTSAQGNQFTYQMSAEPTGNAISSTSNIIVKVEIDTVDSASPYAFNLSLRSVWGMNGMHADGAKASGFKSMVVAQFTGISLQKDDRAFVKYNANTGAYEEAGSGAHIDGNSRYKKGWRHCHIKASNDAFIQVVSVFAVGFGDHFFADSGGDMSITNSNSNFGNTSLRCKGFKSASFTKDKAGQITHVIPPKSLSDVSEISANWVTIDITKTKLVADNTRLYLYGYTIETAPPPTKVQGYTIGARQDGSVGDKIYVQLVSSGQTTATTKSATIVPAGPSVTGSSANTASNPIKWDSSQGQWYLQVSSTNNEIYTTLISNTIYNSIAFSPTTFIKRVPDARVLKDRIYRFRYVLDKDASPIPRAPITGFVVQPRSSSTESPSYNTTYYIYESEEVQKFVAGVTDGVYYLTLLSASTSPSASNFNDFKFSQNVNEVYPAFDRDNPNSDPLASVSVADNIVIGLVYATDGATPTPNKNSQRSITKESTQQFLLETRNNLNYTTLQNTLSGTTVTSRVGDAETRKIPLKVVQGGEVVPIEVELRRHSILRSGNHTFEYLGFGPGNYSTAFPQTQVEVLSADQVKLSQSLREQAGVAFYSGLNSNGDLFIGNQVVNPVTGQITSSDIAQLNVIGEENTTIQTFSELVLTDKLTVLGGASNQLESVFSGPVTFSGKVTGTNNIQSRKFTYSNEDGTVLKQSFLATEITATGLPNVPSTGVAYNNGDLVYNINWAPGAPLGWIYYSGTWYKFGLTDTANFYSTKFTSGTVTGTNWGIGTAPTNANRLEVGGNTKVTGNLTITGTYGLASRYKLATGQLNNNNGVTYNGNGVNETFAVSPGHTAYSVLVFLNGVAQVPGVDYTVTSNNVDFSIGDFPPEQGDVVHIRELPI